MQASGRYYFKNHDTRQTTWVDPRSAIVRKQVSVSVRNDYGHLRSLCLLLWRV